MCAAALTWAQQAPFNIPNPTAGCTATPAELEANKKVALVFFRPGISVPERVALADSSYKQHNPAFVKGAKEAEMGPRACLMARAIGWCRRLC